MTESNGHAAAVAVAEPPTLARELALYRRRLPGWLAGGRAGKYVVIFREQVLGMADTLDGALAIGLRHVGPTEPFLAKQVLAVEPVHFFGGGMLDIRPAEPAITGDGRCPGCGRKNTFVGPPEGGTLTCSVCRFECRLAGDSTAPGLVDA